jgi:hypothetical protein
MGCRDAFHDSKSKAVTWFGTPFFSPDEPLEDAPGIFGLNPGSVIRNGQNREILRPLKV